ncbi:bck1-like resistance to osmotic shock [Coemansia interrupta]|uniref:BRO domain-containing protein 1 n=1 Tax=Coemansia interrupta TaxID=1126814 RepID=A0A9W8LK64_9FUNG|nr:bck1-like resistance to osmotic shock [Coemansia interrupta]
MSNLTAAQQQQQQLYRTLAGSRAADLPAGQSSRPNLTPDDFPVLSGAGEGGGISSADLAPGAGVVDQQSANTDHSTGTANGLETTSTYTPPTANLAKAAAAAAAAADKGGAQGPIGAADRFGMLGILTTNEYGFDVSKFGLPLPSAGLLYPTFGSPWTDQSQSYGLIEPDFKLPACYNASHTQPAMTKIQSFVDETLFYIFYTMPRDELQLAAAEELYRRQWRYHKEMRLWLTKDPESQPTARTQRGEQGVFVFFDPSVWQKVKKEFMVFYEHLEDRGPLTANAESAAAAAAAFRGGAQSVPPSLQPRAPGQNIGVDQDGSSAAAAQAQLQNMIRLNNATASHQQQQQLLLLRQRQQQAAQAAGYSNAAPCIAIPFKKTAEVDWVRPLRQYIARTYQEDPDVYATDCQMLQRMRQDMRGANADETGRDLIFRYYSHLEALEPRFRINEQGVKVTFLWSDAFTNESTQQHSLAFEKAGVLFNLAVAFAMHGARLFSDSSSEMELTTVHMAGIYFQVAADRFHYLNENFLHAPSLDLQQETVNVLNGMMMAQAQECALIKSRLEKKKANTLSKLAQQAALMYSNVYDNLKAIIDSHQLPRGWLLLTETKLRYYQAMAQYHEAHVDESKNRYGTSIARYSLADQHAREATKLVGQFTETFFSTTNLADDLCPESVQGLQEMISHLAANITEELNRANNDNDVIYNEPVPNTSTLPALEAASVVSNFDINKFYASEERSNVVGGELFSRLIPMSVHESSSLYSEEMAKMLRAEEDKVNLADGELQDAFSFMKMPGSLKRFERPLSLSGQDGRSGVNAIISELADPSRAVREAANSVQAAERTNPLSEMRARVEGQRIRATDELADLSRMLDDEQYASEQILTEYASEPLFAGYQPSSRAAAFFREQMDENQKKLADAASLDNSIHNDYKTAIAPWLPTLQNGSDGVISVTIEHLKEVRFEEAASASNAGGESLVDIGQDKPVGLSGHVQAIKDIYEQLLELRKIRRAALAELKSAAQDDDISSSLIKATSAKDLQPLFARELKKYDAHTQRLQAVTSKQSQLVKRISEEFRCLMELPQARAINDKWDAAEVKKSAVEAQVLEAVQVYRHVSDGLDKANRFYTLLLDSLSPFRRQVKEFVTSRAAQRDQLAKQVSRDSAARQQAALKERLNQYAVPSQAQQPQQQRAYQPPMQNAYSPQQGPTQSPSVHGTQTFDMGQLANQTAQMSLHSPTNVSASLPPAQQQPMYSPNGASAPHYQPSAPAPPQNMIQQQQAPPPLQQQHQSQPGYPQPPMQQQQQPQMYSYQQPPQQQSVGQYGSAPLANSEPAVDPYSAAVRRSAAFESSGLTHTVNANYKPGYGGYTTTAVPIQSSTVPTGGGSSGYGGTPNAGYMAGVSAPIATSSGYAPAPPAVSHHHQQQQPVYGVYGEPVPMSSGVAPQQHQQQPVSSAYAPPPFPPPQGQAQAQTHHLQQQPPASFGSTVASNAPQPPPQHHPQQQQQQPLYGTPPVQQQQQQPSYLPVTQPPPPAQHQPHYQPQYAPMEGSALQTVSQGGPGMPAYSNAGPAPTMLVGGAPSTSVGYQQQPYLPPQSQAQSAPLQQYASLPVQQQYHSQQTAGYQQQQPPPPPPQQQQQQHAMSHGYGYQYSAPQQQQPQIQPPPVGGPGPYGGPAQSSQPFPMQQQQQAPVGYSPQQPQQQQQQQPSYLPPPVQQPQPQQPPYHHGYGGNLMD